MIEGRRDCHRFLRNVCYRQLIIADNRVRIKWCWPTSIKLNCAHKWPISIMNTVRRPNFTTCTHSYHRSREGLFEGQNRHLVTGHVPVAMTGTVYLNTISSDNDIWETLSSTYTLETFWGRFIRDRGRSCTNKRLGSQKRPKGWIRTKFCCLWKDNRRSEKGAS